MYTARAIRFLLVGLVIVVLVAEAQGRLSRAPVFSLQDFIAMFLLLAFAFVASRWSQWYPLFWIYGCLGMLPFAARLLAISTRGSGVEIAKTLIEVIFLILAGGGACRICATVGAYWREQRVAEEGHCLSCDYNLTGNVSGICPECGTRFSRQHLVGRTGKVIATVTAHAGSVRIDGVDYEATTGGPIKEIGKGRSVVVRAFRGKALVVTPTSDGLKYK